MSPATRTLVAWCPDWPVVAAGVSLDTPAAVVHANRVVATSPAARLDGVAVGMRRRESQGRCPGLVLIDHDPARDARAFEPVAVALEALTPRLELTVPGRCAFPTRGPSRYFGGDEALAARAAVLTGACVGIADGPFAALLAARTAAARPTVVAPGASANFLAPHPLTVLMPLCTPELVDVLARLGLRTLGELAALPAADVLARFGPEGALAHRVAAGLDERPPATTPPPPELTVEAELDPPAERVDTAAFVARALADDLYQRLASRGMACTRIVVLAETEHGERHERVWRAEGAGGGGGALTAGAMADRIRWQLDGWLNGSSIDPTGVGRGERSDAASRRFVGSNHRPTAGIALLRLVPDEVVPATGRQLGFWGGTTGADERAVRALARIEGLLGPEAVTVPEWRGGRGPGEQVALVPAGAVDLAADHDRARPESVAAPWPGQLPAPSPAAVYSQPVAAEVVTADGTPVGVTGRGFVTGEPARVSVAGNRWQPVASWAGPWPVDERWWDPEGHRRRARFQIVLENGDAFLLAVEQGAWWLEASYD